MKTPRKACLKKAHSEMAYVNKYIFQKFVVFMNELNKVS